MAGVVLGFGLYVLNWGGFGGPTLDEQPFAAGHRFANNEEVAVNLRAGERQVVYTDRSPSGRQCTGVGEGDAVVRFSPVPYRFIWSGQEVEGDWVAFAFVEASRDGRYQIRCTGGGVSSSQDYAVAADARVAGGALGSWAVIFSPPLLGFACGAAITVAVAFRRKPSLSTKA